MKRSLIGLSLGLGVGLLLGILLGGDPVFITSVLAADPVSAAWLQAMTGVAAVIVAFSSMVMVGVVSLTQVEFQAKLAAHQNEILVKLKEVDLGLLEKRRGFEFACLASSLVAELSNNLKRLDEMEAALSKGRGIVSKAPAIEIYLASAGTIGLIPVGSINDVVEAYKALLAVKALMETEPDNVVELRVAIETARQLIVAAGRSLKATAVEKMARFTEEEKLSSQSTELFT